MVINPAEMDALGAYKLATSLLVPRPIAWVGSRAADGTDNLAPFSYFMGVSTRPPSIAISVARGRKGVLKDTAANILETEVFTVSMVSHRLVTPMVQTSLPEGPDVSEFRANGLESVEGDLVNAPRPADALAAMECRLVHAHDMQSTHLLVGEVLRYHIDDAILRTDERGHAVVDLAGLDPIGRLGSYDYCRVTDVFEAKAHLRERIGHRGEGFGLPKVVHVFPRGAHGLSIFAHETLGIGHARGVRLESFDGAATGAEFLFEGRCGFCRAAVGERDFGALGDELLCNGFSDAT